jgi:hypothetical protein
MVFGPNGPPNTRLLALGYGAPPSGAPLDRPSYKERRHNIKMLLTLTAREVPVLRKRASVALEVPPLAIDGINNCFALMP